MYENLHIQKTRLPLIPQYNNKTTCNMTTQTQNIRKDLANKLNEIFKSIKDFNVYAVDNVVKGGFYEMGYKCPVTGDKVEYYFHEFFMKIQDSDTRDLATLISEGTASVMKKLEWQKNQDENYAKEFGKDVKYQFDYSILTA